MPRSNTSKLILIAFFSQLYFYSHVGTLYLRFRGLSFLEISSLAGIILVTLFLVEVPSGVLADRIGRKKTYLLALGFQLVGEIAYCFANTYWHFVGTSILAGFNWAFISGCASALLYDSLRYEGREDQMTRESGRIRSMEEIAAITSSLLGGLLIPELELGRFTFAIGLTALGVAISLLMALTLEEPRYGKDGEDSRPYQLLRDGIQLLHQDKRLKHLVMLSIFASPLLISFLDLYQPMLIAAAVPPVWLGTVRAFRSVFGILASRYAWWIEQKLGVRRGLPALIIAIPLCYVAIALISHPIGSTLLVCLGYGLARAQQPLYDQYYNAQIKSRNRATVLSLISMLGSVWEGGIGLAVGRAADTGLSNAYFLMAGLVLVGSVALLPRSIRQDRQNQANASVC
jgi:MFS family permease